MTFQDDNGSVLQFNGDFAMTKQAISLFNGEINGDVSINFDVENNSVNRKFLNYDGPQMLNQVAWTKQPVSRNRLGNVIDRGHIVVQSDEGDSLSCFYLSGNSNWIQLVQGLITELDFTGTTNGTDYNTLWNESNVSSLASATSGMIFPFLDWGYSFNKGYTDYYVSSLAPLVDSTNDIVLNPVLDFYPCFFLSSLVGEIANQNGFKIAGNVLSDPIFKSMVLPPVNGRMKRNPLKNVFATASQTFGIALSQVNTFVETYDPDGLFLNNAYTTNKKTSLRFTFNVTGRSNNDTIIIHVYKNGVTYANVSLALYQTVIINEVNVTIGDVCTVWISDAGAGPTVGIGLSMKIENIEYISFGDYVNPSYFLPELKSIDILKFVFNYFGCSVYYNGISKTLTATIIEKIKTEEAYDWSLYYVSHKADYTLEQATNNYIRFKQNEDDSLITNYDSKHTVKFGDGNLTTGNTLKNDQDIIEFPFSPSASDFSKNLFYNTSIQLIDLVKEGDSIAYSAIAAGGAGIANFTVPDGLIFFDNEILSVTDSSGYSLGYFSVISRGATTIGLRFSFLQTGTGYIYRQKVNYKTVSPRLLTVKNTSVSDFSGSSAITINGNSYSSVSYGVFTKQSISKNLDLWKSNLSIDNPDSGGFSDPTIKALYFGKVSRILNKPTIVATMILPESAYMKFKFDQFIYLKTERLTGYFFVKSIENYVDSNTPCEINLYML